MNKKKYVFTKTVEIPERDFIGLMDTAIEGGAGYWCCIGNDTPEWDVVRDEYPDACIDELMYRILAKGESVILIDEEDDDKQYELTMGKLLKGVQMTIDNGHWDGDVMHADGVVGDCIFQYALFDELIYG